MAQSAHVVYLDGRFVQRQEAHLDVEDRAALFGDGVYEVIRYYRGRGFEMQRHQERLAQSLQAIAIAAPAAVALFPQVCDELVQRNGMADAKLYWQISRGQGPRDHLIASGLTPTVLALAYPAAPLDGDSAIPSHRACLVEDVRWHWCHIKSLMLLANVLALEQARQKGDSAAILHRGAVVTEAAAQNVMMVRDGQLWTHPADQWVLHGVTRAVLLELARENGLICREETFTCAELQQAQEIILTGTTTHVAAVLSLDGQPVAGGEIGPVTRQLHQWFNERVRRACP